MRKDVTAQTDASSRSVLGSLAFLVLATIVAFVLPEGDDRSDTENRTRAATGANRAGRSELGRGHDAGSPAKIPRQGWKDVLWRTYEQIGEDRLLAVAAGVVFYGLLALFPAITALVSSYALFAEPKTINDHLAFLSDVLPGGTFSIVQDQVGRVLSKGEAKLGAAFAVSLVLAIWSANGGMKAIIDALNVVYDEREKRGFVKLNVVSLAFTLGGLLAVLAAIGLVVATPILLSLVGLGRVGDVFAGVWTVARPGPHDPNRVGGAISVRSQPAIPKVEMGLCRKRFGDDFVAPWLGASLLLFGKLRQLRCDIRLARCRNRVDDVDVDVDDCRAVRRGTEFRDRAPDGHERLSETGSGS
jgi:hypothetical protein